MRLRTGLYRKTFGAEIVESSFDFDTNTIGNIIIPVPLPHQSETVQSCVAPYKLYEQLLYDKEALAVVDVNGNCFGIIRRDRAIIKGAGGGTPTVLQFDSPLDLPDYEHIGYIKTYPKNLSVYHYPWYLIRDKRTHEVDGFPGVVLHNVALNPHVSMYKNLIDTESTAIYYDVDKQAFQFI